MNYCPTCSGVLFSEPPDPVDFDRRMVLTCLACGRFGGRVGELPSRPNEAALFVGDHRRGRPRKVAS